MSGEVATAQPVRIARLTIPAARVGGYDLLLGALLAFTAAARLWLVPGYFRADTWLALTAGRDIWSSGVPHHETLTAIAGGERWVDQQWLAHLVTYGLYRAGGFGAVAALSVLLAAAAFGAMAVAARLRGARARTVLALMPVTAFPFFAQSWQPRTQMFAYPLFAAVFLLVLRDSRRHSRRVLLVLPVLALWGNIHGSVALGAVLVCLRGATLAWERRGLLGNPRAWRMPIALVALAPLTLLITPYGAGTARYYRATLLDGSFKRLATEWQPITHDPVLLAPFIALLAITTWVLVRARATTTVWERIALVVLLAGAATALRNMVWLSLGALPVMALALDRVVPADPAPTRFGMRMNHVLAVTAEGLVVIAVAVTASRPASAFQADYPQRYLDAVRQASTADPTARIVADVGDADWLLWKAPALRGRLAFDARLELLPASGVHDIASLLSGSPQSPLRRGSYRIFALDRRSARATVQQLVSQPGHRVVFADARRIVIRLPG